MKRYQVFTLAIVLTFIVLLGNPAPTRAESGVNYYGHLAATDAVPNGIDSDWYSASAQAGQTVKLTFNYRGYCYAVGSRLNVFIGTQVDSILLDWSSLPPITSYPTLLFGATETFSRTMPTSGEVQIGFVLEGLAPLGIAEGCIMNYWLTVEVVNATYEETVQNEIEAGLQRVGSDPSLPVVIYVPTPVAFQSGALFIDIWQLDEHSIGHPALTISANELLALPDYPTQNTLIANTPNGFISVYKLTTGEYQVNVGPLSDGKIHVVIFDGIPLSHTYGYTWETPE